MSRYKFNLKPLTPYFFGGNKTFDDATNSKKITNYHSESLLMPQQTTIIGFLRYEVLRCLNLLGTRKTSTGWDKAIGQRSFQLCGTNSFGNITRISPVFISNGSNYYLPAPLEYYQDDKYNVGATKNIYRMAAQLNAANEGGVNAFDILENVLNREISGVLNGEAYTGKNDRINLFVHHTGKVVKLAVKDINVEFVHLNTETINLNTEPINLNTETINLNEEPIFIPVTRVGNKKSINIKIDAMQGNFFMQTYYQLSEGFQFTFFAELDLPENKQLKGGIVKMGGEQSVFKLEVTKIPEEQNIESNTFEGIFTKDTFEAGSAINATRVILTSDSIVTKQLLDNLQFANCDYSTFNYIAGNNQVANYAQLNDNRKKMENDIFTMQRGSVLYPKDITRFVNDFDEYSKKYNYKSIGFNHFIIC